MKRSSQKNNSSLSYNFAGYAPAGWQRGDEFIEDEVCRRLATDSSLDATGIQVEVNGGTVTLTGYVPTQRGRQTANNIAMNVLGIKALTNQLTIAATAPHQTADRPQGQTAGGKSRT